MAARPVTAVDWAQHAERLHGEGLSVLDKLTGRSLPTDVAGAALANAAVYFAAAQSAAAIATATDLIGYHDLAERRR